jgi:hypothetical protein
MLLYVLNNAGSQTSQINPDDLINGIMAAVQSGKINQSLIDADAQKVLDLQAQTVALITH